MVVLGARDAARAERPVAQARTTPRWLHSPDDWPVSNDGGQPPAGAATRLANASGTFTENIRTMQGAAALALQATTQRPPDRLTYVLRGMAAGAPVVIVAVVVI
jgi:hypothetical protein